MVCIPTLFKRAVLPVYALLATFQTVISDLDGAIDYCSTAKGVEL